MTNTRWSYFYSRFEFSTEEFTRLLRVIKVLNLAHHTTIDGVKVHNQSDSDNEALLELAEIKLEEDASNASALDMLIDMYGIDAIQSMIAAAKRKKK